MKEELYFVQAFIEESSSAVSYSVRSSLELTEERLSDSFSVLFMPL